MIIKDERQHDILTTGYVVNIDAANGGGDIWLMLNTGYSVRIESAEIDDLVRVRGKPNLHEVKTP